MQIRLMPRRLMGQTIRGIRNRLGMSQAEFGESLGVDGSAVSKWEKGQTQPEYGTLAKIATMVLVERAANRTAVEVLEAAAGTAKVTTPATADALVLDAEVRLETRPRARS